MKYPYIVNNNLMFYAKNTATFVGDEDNLNTHGFKIAANESKFTNITREYLEGKCVKIESPEHGELVQKLAFNAGFKWREYSGNIRSVASGDFINLRSNGRICCGCRAIINKQITIPLPSKAEPKEWPQVSDDVVICDKSNLEELFRFKGKSCKVIRVAYYEGVKVLTVANKQQGIAAFNMGEWIKKPKTEAEILRDELHAHFEKYTFQDQAINELHLNFNITKKV